MVAPPALGVEINAAAKAMAFEPVAVVMLVLEFFEIDAEIFEQVPHLVRPIVDIVEALRAAIGHAFLAVALELVALGVAAEIVMIVEHQNAGLPITGVLIKIRRGEPAGAAADDDQIIFLAGLTDAAPILAPFMGQFMGALEGAGMAAAHAVPGRRIVGRAVRRRHGFGLDRAGRLDVQRIGRGNRAGADQRSIEKITPRDAVLGHRCHSLLYAFGEDIHPAVPV